MAKSAFQIVIHKKIAECFINKMDSGSQFLILVEVCSYFTYAYIFAEDDPKLLANFYAACCMGTQCGTLPFPSEVHVTGD